MGKFTGFIDPEQNWSKLPHQLIDEMHNISSISELKVILYVLRHTWGFKDSQKRITIDEFVQGRKRKDGTRIDEGCGLSPNSVRDGLKRAQEHGYLRIEVDDSDKARIEKTYSLTMQKPTNRGAKVEPLGANLEVQKLNPDMQKLNHWGAKVEPRTEKETLERNLEKDNYTDTSTNRSQTVGGGSRRSRQTDEEYGKVCARYEQEFGMLTATIADTLSALMDEYQGATMILDAFNVAAKQNKRKLSYVEGILQNWRKEGKREPKPKAQRVKATVKLQDSFTGAIIESVEEMSIEQAQRNKLQIVEYV
jgi:DnaD/phage-associated family protein